MSRRITYRVIPVSCSTDKPDECDGPPVYQVISNRGRVDVSGMCGRHAGQWCDYTNRIETNLAAARGTK